MQRLKALINNDNSAEFEPITGSGSNRQYWRIRPANGESVIGCIGTNAAENRAFIYLSRKFAAAGLPVPTILAVSDDEMAYVQTDLGNTALFDCLDRTDLIARTIELLPRVQAVADLDYSYCYPIAEFDRRSVMWDLNYFKYCYLKATGIEIDESALEDDFDSLAAMLLSAEPRGFMYRDFQSRNVIICNNQPWLIDYQGGRRGPVHYDVVSFLWQARAGFSPEFRREMIDRYISAAGVDAAQFQRSLPAFILFRTMQVLGAYGFRGYFERKPHFLKSIPPALANLRELLNSPDAAELMVSLPYLNKILRKLCSQLTL
jgi:aminoglycoside/choline kinase family phosphotransferase